jgi:transcriptional regulator with XRE-family HTH domain
MIAMQQAPEESLTIFLRTRRGRVTPESHGLPTGRKRRSKGLRREEVAELLGVSPLWYALFERGQSERRFSAAFLERLQDVLGLDAADREYFSRIVIAGGYAAPEFEVDWYSTRWRTLAITISALADSLESITDPPDAQLARESLTALLAQVRGSIPYRKPGGSLECRRTVDLRL